MGAMAFLIAKDNRYSGGAHFELAFKKCSNRENSASFLTKNALLALMNAENQDFLFRIPG